MRIWVTRWMAMALMAGAAALMPAAARGDWDEDQTLAYELKRRGLTDLEVALRQQQLKGQLTPARKVMVVRRILDAYLVKANTAPKLEEKKKWLEVALAFWNAHKGIARDTKERLDFDLVEADLLSTYGKFYLDQWRIFPEEESWRAKAEKNFTDALGKYRELITRLEDRQSKLEDFLGENPEKSRQWQEASADVARTQFNIAWTNYRLGLVQKSAEKKKEYLQKSIEEFKPFTETFNPHPVVIECLIGQSLASNELGNYKDTLAFLKPVTSQNAQPGQYKQVVFLRLEAMVGLGQYLDANSAATRYAADLPEDPKKLEWFDRKILLKWIECLTLLAKYTTDEPRKQTYKKQASEVATRLYSLGEPWRTQVLRLLKDYAGALQESPLQRYLSVKSNFEARRWQAAYEGATELIKNPDKKLDAPTQARILFYGAASAYNTGHVGEAADYFTRIVKEYGKDPLAPRAAVLAIRCQRMQLAGKPDEATYQTMLSLMNTVQKQWPKTADIRDFPLYKAKALADLGRGKEAMDILPRIDKASPIYYPSRVVVAFVELRDVPRMRKADPKSADAALARAWQALQAFYKNAKMDDELGQEFAGTAARVHIGYVWSLLDARPKATAEIIQALSGFEKLSAAHQRLETEVQALRAAAYLEGGQVEQALGVLGATASPVQVTAGAAAESYLRLIKAAQAAARELKGPKKDANERALMRLTIPVLEGLVEFYKSTGQSQTKTAVSIRFLLGERLLEQGKYDKALPIYEFAIKALPAEQDLRARRGLALCQVYTKKYKEALENWRQIVPKVLPDSRAWWEARYYLVYSLLKSGEVDQASRVFQQIEILHPDLGGDEWRNKFLEIKAQLKPVEPAKGEK